MVNAATILRLPRLRARSSEHPDAYGVLTRSARALKSFWCLLNGGHFKVLHAQPDRLALRCVACGHTTPGWHVQRSTAEPRYPADRERLRLVGRADQLSV